MPPSPPPADDSDELDEEDVLAAVLPADGVPVPVAIGPSRRFGFSLLDICECCNRVNGCCGWLQGGELDAAMTAADVAGAGTDSEGGVATEATAVQALSAPLLISADDDGDNVAVKG
uniref:Uncharacterized protein n=1 Tax=Ceratitis capitata TaxID=7213 RepID=W8BU88_CERCA